MEGMIDNCEDQLGTLRSAMVEMSATFDNMPCVDARTLRRFKHTQQRIISRAKSASAAIKADLDALLFDDRLVGAVLTERILGLGGNVHAKIGGTSVLHAAELGGRYGIVPTLLSNGADVNQRDGFGNSPLHNACDTTNPPCLENVRVLLKAGADPTARAGFPAGLTPIERLEEDGEGHEDVVLLLRKVDTRRKWGFIDVLRRRAGREREKPVKRRWSPRLPLSSAAGAVEYLQLDASDGVFRIVMSFL